MSGTVVERLESRQNFHDRRFAGTVRSDQTDVRFRSDQPVGVFEEQFVAIALAGPGELNHDVGFIVSWTRAEWRWKQISLPSPV